MVHPFSQVRALAAGTFLYVAILELLAPAFGHQHGDDDAGSGGESGGGGGGGLLEPLIRGVDEPGAGHGHHVHGSGAGAHQHHRSPSIRGNVNDLFVLMLGYGAMALLAAWM